MDDEAPEGFHQQRKVRWPMIAGIVAAHLLALVGLTYAFAPDFSRMVVEKATSLVVVTVRTVESREPAPSPANRPDEGAAAEEGAEETPRAVVAPPVPRPRDNPAPRASSTGRANASGAGDSGAGTGGGGEGDGTGSGRGGSGRGGIMARGPSVRSGTIATGDARLFPIPEGGREVRFGTSITVHFTVEADGTATGCRVAFPGPEPLANARACAVVMDRIRFNPAIDTNGDPMPAPYGYRIDFSRR